MDDPCISHCISHSLSHPSDRDLFAKCKKIHDQRCEECSNVVSCISSLKNKFAQLPLSHEREVAEWEIANSERKIMDWQKHIMRGVQQSKARSKAFQTLGLTLALWLRDYAQKFLPTKVC